MSVLVDITVERTDKTGAPMKRIAVAPEEAQKVVEAMVYLVTTSKGGRVRRGKAVKTEDIGEDDEIDVPAGASRELATAGEGISQWAIKQLEAARVKAIAGTDTVNDASSKTEVVTKDTDGSQEARDTLTMGDPGGYPASHFDGPEICGTQQPDMHGTSRCASIRGHRGRHTWRKVLA